MESRLSKRERYLLADSVWKCNEVLLAAKRGDSTLFNNTYPWKAL